VPPVFIHLAARCLVLSADSRIVSPPPLAPVVLPFTGAPTPLQVGIAKALDEDHSHGPETAKLMADNAEILAGALTAAGLPPYEAQGGYFLVCDVGKTGLTDVEFCKALVKHAQ
jgi:aspartate/methionine/tyrosine aminotransferase